jgi:hypothetical protein
MRQRVLRSGLPRDPRATTYLIGFVVSTVVTILIVRAALAATGYPKLGGGGLHIAHELWGGLLLALAIVLSMSFIGQVIRPYVAIVAGIGFGLFLDEVGKFVTSTTDYFFRPALAIIYVTVVFLVLLIHWLHGRKPTTPAEFLAAALAEVCAAAGGGFSDHRRARALQLVSLSGDQPDADQPDADQARMLIQTLIQTMPAGKQLGDPLIAMRRLVQRIGPPLVRLRVLRWITVGLLVLTATTQLITSLGIAIADIFDPGSLSKDINNISSIGGTVAATLAAVCVILGLRLIRRDRLAAYGWFERAVLVNLLLTDVFTITSDQFSALPAIILDLIMLGVLGAARSQLAFPGGQIAPLAAPMAEAPIRT